MSKRLRIGFLILVIAAVAVLMVWPYLAKGKDSEDEPVSTPETPRAALDQALTGDRVVILVFSYDSQCCPSTEPFFSAYKKSVYESAGAFGEDVQLVWVNTGVESPEEQQEIQEIAREYEVTYIPTLLVIDKNKQVVESLVGPFDAALFEEIVRREVGTN
mgnify:FL=1